MAGAPFSQLTEGQERLRIGIFGFLTLDRQLVEDTVGNAGWAFTYSSAIERSWELWSKLDLVILGPHEVSDAFLAFLTEAWDVVGIPILVIADAHEPRVVADILRAGASDYMPAPFAFEELEARIRVLTMRQRGESQRVAGARLGLDHVTRTVHAGPLHVSLSPREWSALMVLLESESQLVTVEDMSRALTGAPDNETIVISTISRLRKKLQAHRFVPLTIQTVYGQGYVARWRKSSESLHEPGHLDS